MGIPQRALNWMSSDYRSFLEHQQRGTPQWFITRDYIADERSTYENDKRIVLADLLGTNANGVGMCNHESCWTRRGLHKEDLEYRGKNERLIRSMSMNRCCTFYLYYQAEVNQGSDGRIKEPPRQSFENDKRYVQSGPYFDLGAVAFPYRFRLYDDDDNLYYEGWQTEQDFEPLDDFATANAGATYMKTSDNGGPFIIL